MKSEKNVYLLCKDSKEPIPLKKISIKGTINQSVASMEMIQEYHNEEDNPIESVFHFPMDVDALITKLFIDFTLDTGEEYHLESEI